MSFRSVFIALVIGFGLVLAGVSDQPRSGRASRSTSPRVALVRATGQVRRVPHAAAAFDRPRVRAERPRRARASTASTAISRRQGRRRRIITASSSARR